MSRFIFFYLAIPLASFSNDTLKMVNPKTYYHGINIKYGLWYKVKQDSTARKETWNYLDSSYRLVLEEVVNKRKKRRLRTFKYKLRNYEDSSIISGKYGYSPYYLDRETQSVFSFTGRKLAVNHFKCRMLHGIQHDYKNHTKTRYKYGFEASNMYNSKKQKYVYYFTYGLPKFGDFSYVENLYACRKFAIAGCFVNGRILRKAAVHNFFVNVKQTFRFGIGWKRKYF